MRWPTRPGPAPSLVLEGTWVTKKVADGLIVDRWTLADGEPTLTWRSVNRRKQVWELRRD